MSRCDSRESYPKAACTPPKYICFRNRREIGWNRSHLIWQFVFYASFKIVVCTCRIIKSWRSLNVTIVKLTFITRVAWMVQLKSLSHSKIPIMISHGARHLFDYHRKREDVWVQKKKLAVINEDREICLFLQMEKDLVIFIIRSYSSFQVKGEVSSVKRGRKVLDPKWRVHERFVLFEAYVCLLHQICQIVGFFNNTFLDVACISAPILNNFHWRCDVVGFPTFSGNGVSGNNRYCRC